MTAVRGTVNRAASKPKVGFGSLSPVHPNYATGRNEYIAASWKFTVNDRLREIYVFLTRNWGHNTRYIRISLYEVVTTWRILTILRKAEDQKARENGGLLPKADIASNKNLPAKAGFDTHYLTLTPKFCSSWSGKQFERVQPIDQYLQSIEHLLQNRFVPKLFLGCISMVSEDSAIHQ